VRPIPTQKAPALIKNLVMASRDGDVARVRANLDVLLDS
jgi:hypothetical protein